MDKSEREVKYKELIEMLKANTDLLADIPDDLGTGYEEVEEYRLLAGYWKYLMKKKKNSNSDEQKELSNKISEVQEYLLIAQFGDKNIKRFNT